MKKPIEDTIGRCSKIFNCLSPAQVMVLGFAGVIFLGAMLLTLPMASQDGRSIGFLNALFTSTSAVCVTGLVVVDTATHWTLFGQIVIISLVQVGGLGFMTFATMLAIIIKRKINLRERLLIQESLNHFDLSGLVRLSKYVWITTFTIEGFGALLLSTVFIPEFGWSKGIWYSVFHGISAFCNAGFDLMGGVSGNYSSLTYYIDNTTINLTIGGLIVLGGLGFPVILDILRTRRFSKLSIHSKIVLTSTAILIIIGTILIFTIEYNNPDTIGNLSIKSKLLGSLFQSITPRTAGFNTIDLTKINEGSLFIIIILMFIGASPASTGGGIKTTTLATLILTVKTFIVGKEDVEIYNRRISYSIVNKAVGVFFMAITIVVISTLILTISEPKFNLVESLFEVVSALATVGLSIVGSFNLSSIGKFVIIFCMFAGRVGSLTVLIAIAARGDKKQLIRYPEGKIIVG
jgi:trk system potassium uptake protein